MCVETEGPGRAALGGEAWARPVELDLAPGRNCFFAVPSGRQRLTVTLREGGALEQTLEVVPGEQLELRAGAGGLEWTGRHRTAAGTGFDARRLRELPGGAEPWSLVETAEPVAISDRIDGGGHFTATPGRFSTHGSSWTQVTFAEGLLDVTDPLHTGIPLVWPDLLPGAAYDVATAAMGVEAGPPGARVTLQPPLPPERWTLSAEATTTLGEGRAQGPPESTPTDGPEPPLARFGHWRRAAVTAGGPLTGTLRGSLAATMEDGRRFERGLPEPLDGDLRTLGGRLLWSPGTQQELRVHAALQSLERPSAGRFLFADPELRERDRVHALQAHWESRRPGGWVATAAAGHVSAALEADGGAGAGTFERLHHGPLPLLPLPGRTERSRTDGAVHVQLAPWTSGAVSHALRLGVSAARTGARTEPLTLPVLTGELLGGRPARAWRMLGGGETHWSGTDLAVFASDDAAIGSRLHVQGGLRLETSAAAAEGGDTVRWSALSPRVSARARLLGPLTLVAGYARYRHRLPLGLLAWGDAQAPRGEVFRWDDPNRDGVFQAGELGTLVARTGPGAPVAERDPDLRAPRTREVLAGLEGRFGGWRVALTGIHRQESGLVESVNVGVPLSSYTVRTIPDPAGDLAGPQDDQLLPLYARLPATFGADHFLLTNPDGHSTTHQGVELIVELLADRVQVLLGATAHRSDGSGAFRGFRPEENDQGLVGDLFDDPNTSTHSRGRLFSDRAYTIKLSGSWRAPGDVRLGAVARYQDGQPFARLVLADLPQGLTAVQAIQNGRARFTFELTLDARLEKGFSLGTRGRAAAVIEGFNLLQRGHEVEEDAVSGPAYRTVTFRQPPRSLRVGMRLEL